MKDAHDCPNFGRWHGCQLEPRYNYGPSQYPGGHYVGSNLAALVEKFREKTYVGEVCVRCGRQFTTSE